MWNFLGVTFNPNAEPTVQCCSKTCILAAIDPTQTSFFRTVWKKYFQIRFQSLEHVVCVQLPVSQIPHEGKQVFIGRYGGGLSALFNGPATELSFIMRSTLAMFDLRLACAALQALNIIMLNPYRTSGRHCGCYWNITARKSISGVATSTVAKIKNLNNEALVTRGRGLCRTHSVLARIWSICTYSLTCLIVPFSRCFFMAFLMRNFFLSSSIPGYFFVIYFMTDWYDTPDLSLEDCKGGQETPLFFSWTNSPPWKELDSLRLHAPQQLQEGCCPPCAVSQHSWWQEPSYYQWCSPTLGSFFSPSSLWFSHTCSHLSTCHREEAGQELSEGFLCLGAIFHCDWCHPYPDHTSP